MKKITTEAVSSLDTYINCLDWVNESLNKLKQNENNII